jgi:hypothetical protein
MSHCFHGEKLRRWKLYSFMDTVIPVRTVRQRGVEWNGKQESISVGKVLILDSFDCATKPDSRIGHGMLIPEYQ